MNVDLETAVRTFRASENVQTTSTGNYWWVNHKQTYAQEVGGGYLWSPVSRSDGGYNEFYENMKRVRPGDIVFSYADARIRAVGICTAPAALMPKPSEFGTAGDAWQAEGWKLPISFTVLKIPFRPKTHMEILAPLLPGKYSPIRATGDGNQAAYLAAVPPAMAYALIQLLEPHWAALERDTFLEGQNWFQSTEAADATTEKAVHNRTDIGATEKWELVQSRRGQGVYRRNLESHETRCRVTGTTNLRHLRASHIKPWRVSTDFEKLDGNNGLLLSPHVDHLFDQGFISFTDAGEFLVSPSADLATLKLWQIDPRTQVGQFRPEQRLYLAYHRDFVLRKT